LHLLENQHPTGKIDNTMEVLYTTKSGPRRNTVVQFCIYKGTENDKQLNDKHTALSNSIFIVITQQDYYD